MRRALAVLRPEPGNAATVAAIRALGRTAVPLPLFTVGAVPWSAATGVYDALILTSANAVRHAGPELERHAHLPVHAVGGATAAAARDAGLRVVAAGDADGQALLDAAAAAGVRQALMLTARDRAVTAHPVLAAIRAVYAVDAVPGVDVAALTGTVALVHSPRAGKRLAALVAERGDIAVAAISARAAATLGAGWRSVAVAAAPTDAAVIAAGMLLAGD